MPQPPPAAVGIRLAEVDTPALVVDLDAFERNLDRMAGFVRQAGVRVRPHSKTHKSPDIAARQIARGAVGVCCQKVSEAEVMVAGGVGDVLVSNEVAGAGKLDRLAALARRAKVAVCTDDAGSVAEIEAAAAKAQVRLDVLVEIDVGGRRCGITPGAAAAALAKRIASSPHLRFAGLQAYHGSAQHVRDAAERGAHIARAVAQVKETLAALKAVGLEAETIAGAGTGTYEHESASKVYTELQAGSYIFMDADYAKNDWTESGIPHFEHSLFVWTTVMSRPSVERAIVDAGLKASSIDSGMPRVADDGAVEYVKASDEHGVLALNGAAGYAVGDKLKLIPGHCDPTVNLYDYFVCIRAGRVEAFWPITARGAVW
jgi:3-hydroxy-D-aspartate aldolase